MKTRWNVHFLVVGMALSSLSLFAGESFSHDELEKMPRQEERACLSLIYPDANSDEEEESFFQEAMSLSADEIRAKSVKAGGDVLVEKGVENELNKKSALSYTSDFRAYHSTPYITPFGEIVYLEDNSQWIVKPSDREKTLDWYTNHRIIITPNQDWFSSYCYRLHNENTGDSVRVNWLHPSDYNGLNTHWIIGIDEIHKKICLEDGSIWKVSVWDSAELQKMVEQDTVIIGTNNGWFSTTRPNILINWETKEYVKVRREY